MSNQKVIGGVLGLPDSIGQGNGPSFLTEDSAYFVNARSALFAFLRATRPRCVWLPSFLCRTILTPLFTGKWAYRFFPVDGSLQVSPGPWLDGVGAGDVVLLIAYFGFATEETITRVLHARGAIILEDASQALLSPHVGRFSDYVLLSPRKTVGVPDGGILRPGTLVRNIALMSPPRDWWLTTFQACLLRRDSDLYGGDPERRWFKLYREASAKMPCGCYAISPLSEMLLWTSFDYTEVAARRRANFHFLLDNLRDIAVYRELPDDVVPLGFPVAVEDRALLQEALYRENIYPPVHWDIETVVPQEYVESHELSKRILTLVCDHRYDLEDMERTVRCVQSALARHL